MQPASIFSIIQLSNFRGDEIILQMISQMKEHRRKSKNPGQNLHWSICYCNRYCGKVW